MKQIMYAYYESDTNIQYELADPEHPTASQEQQQLRQFSYACQDKKDRNWKDTCRTKILRNNSQMSFNDIEN